ncbi:cytochrome-c peroxidase [Sphingobacterium bambusae]|uniref:Cytochrome-c peroxidase n=1 Tax=Sphingobacterium bambusae TaxID=662858 RepID=A0ABW6BAQ3_9SPHI|nr:cytochrome-c peroxidase [Sphingobacterium bambusae]WPL48785.1 cytochrome-c peroxidase [Sphingobacterium bambusae]
MRFKRYPYFLRVVLLLALPIFLAFVQDPATLDIDALRKLYAGPTVGWPQATLDSGIVFRELGVLPNAPIQARDPQYKAMIELGKTLFFDPRLSASQQISCSSCHDPDMHWTDGRVRAIGHNHRIGMRNSPSISFAWASEKLFWDGRANSLEEQIKGSLTNKNEMNASLPEMRHTLLQIEAYRPLFQEAYAHTEPSVDQLVSAVVVFMRSIRSA